MRISDWSSDVCSSDLALSRDQARSHRPPALTVMAHPLDRPVWSALTTRQAGFAIGDAGAVRFDPEVAVFAAATDAAPQSLAALARTCLKAERSSWSNAPRPPSQPSFIPSHRPHRARQPPP